MREKRPESKMKYSRDEIRALLNSIPLADTHEHLLNESDRIENGPKDIGLFFTQYLDAEWELCGLSKDSVERLKDPLISAVEKWQIVKPYYELVRHNAYGQMIRRSLKLLYGIDDFCDENIDEIQQKIESCIRPGYYKKILELCNIDHCQVNALDTPYFRSPDVESMYGDLCVTTLCSDLDIHIVEEILGHKVKSLKDLTMAIDLVFEKYGKDAIAIKNQAAYTRSLHFARWEEAVVEHCFDFCLRKKWKVEDGEQKPLEDFLTHYTIEKAAEYSLPYKFHTGMTAGCNNVLFYTVRDHGADCAYLCTEHPDTNFVFMHMMYPYQHEALALAKQYPNAYIDMCWSWMINPQAAIQFLKEAIVSIPIHKLLIFGGDVSYIELLPGHVDMASQGIAQALFELQNAEWLESNMLLGLVEQLFWKNAEKLFSLPRV
jgi:uncharacterized protein